jgi:hypothetical protein
VRKAVLFLLALCAAAAPLAHAHGDPAGEWLLERFLFMPPDAGVSSGDTERLTSLLRAAHRQGYTLHVAVIPTRYDLGEQAVLFDQPHRYALSLSQDLRAAYEGRVLVVMRSGYAIARDGRVDPADQRALDGLAPPSPFQAGALAAATEQAIRRLTGHAGVHLAVAPIRVSGGSSTTRDRITIGVAAAILVTLAGALSAWRRSGAAARRRAR